MSDAVTPETTPSTLCKHCGDECPDTNHMIGEDIFCCNGCKMVFQLLDQNGLAAYYQYEVNPGVTQRQKKTKNFDYLDNTELVEKLLLFHEGDIAKIKFHLPQIHCSSCLYLLENISNLNKGITSSRVNFVAKEVTLTYRESDTTLRSIVELLSKIGYEPRINYDHMDEGKSLSKYDRSLLYKLGLAGFAFGNIMLLSFPEYLGFDKASYLFHIGYINIILATPVLLYSGIDYIKSAWRDLRMSTLNIDLPIAIGMITLYSRSLYELITHTGEGYLDSFAGFVFFLLIGRWFQSYTSQALNFDRSYKSYFPISATIRSAQSWITKSLDEINPGDILRIKNEELIPVDGILLKGKARVDYSFVTGEADHISKSVGEEVFAGGKHQGESIEITTTKRVDQSYLTQLWNDDTFKEKQVSSASKLIAWISKYFTIAILTLAAVTMIYWYTKDSSIAFQTFTSVLIVACPCALALAVPFTYGNLLRLLVKSGMHLRNVEAIENIQDISHIIFDKTGTITDNNRIKIEYQGQSLSENELTFIKSACSHSSHPLSKAIVAHHQNTTLVDIDKYEDYIGQGFEAYWNGDRLRIGSSSFIFGSAQKRRERGVFIEINDKYIGYYKFEHAIREHAREIIDGLKDTHKLILLSGDADTEKERMSDIFGNDTELYFQQTPHDKLSKIKALQDEGHKVMMIGDGLNDAGALKQSNVGIVISDAVNNFSPACDGILHAQVFSQLLQIINFVKASRFIIYGAFILALLYNSIGLYYAITGQLSPVIAAILMPLSSISVMVYGVISSYVLYQFYLSAKSTD